MRFAAWTLKLRLSLARHRARLSAAAPSGAPQLQDWPDIRARRAGEGDGTLTLRFGEGVSFGRRVVIDVWAGGDNVLELERGVRVEDGVRILLRGGHLHLGAHSTVGEGGVVDVEGLLITGRNAELGVGAVVHCKQRVELGDDVALAERCSVSDSEHGHEADDVLPGSQAGVEPVEISSDTHLGPNTVIERGVRLGRRSQVAAGALVCPGDYPAGWLVAGSPARAIRPLDDGSDDDRPIGRLPDRTLS